MEREAETERIFLEAEAYTRGNWTNAAGTRARVSDREILTGRQAVFDRYASEEAREFFLNHPRPTSAYWRGQDTRVTGRYTERHRTHRRTRALGWAPPRVASRPGRKMRALGWHDQDQREAG